MLSGYELGLHILFTACVVQKCAHRPYMLCKGMSLLRVYISRCVRTFSSAEEQTSEQGMGREKETGSGNQYFENFLQLFPPLMHVYVVRESAGQLVNIHDQKGKNLGRGALFQVFSLFI